MVRKPTVAGMFYPVDFSELDKQIKQCFESKYGPGALPINKREKEFLGIISPHAGYPYSGPAAAWAYKEIAESKFCDTYILLGLSHSGYPSSVSLDDWQTPFGIIKTNKRLGKSIIENSGIEYNEESHSQEHSIEVQLPFLQFAVRDQLKDLKILPIIVSSDYKKIADSIAKTIKESKKRIGIIASSDFTHYGINYGYFPFSDNIKENMYNLDKGALQAIKNLNSDEFLRYIEKTGATICGKIPIATIINTTKLLGATKASVLHYYTSGDIVNEYNSAVGYASVIIR